MRKLGGCNLTRECVPHDSAMIKNFSKSFSLPGERKSFFASIGSLRQPRLQTRTMPQQHKQQDVALPKRCVLQGAWLAIVWVHCHDAHVISRQNDLGANPWQSCQFPCLVLKEGACHLKSFGHTSCFHPLFGGLRPVQMRNLQNVVNLAFA